MGAQRPSPAKTPGWQTAIAAIAGLFILGTIVKFAGCPEPEYPPMPPGAPGAAAPSTPAAAPAVPPTPAPPPDPWAVAASLNDGRPPQIVHRNCREVVAAHRRPAPTPRGGGVTLNAAHLGDGEWVDWTVFFRSYWRTRESHAVLSCDRGSDAMDVSVPVFGYPSGPFQEPPADAPVRLIGRVDDTGPLGWTRFSRGVLIDASGRIISARRSNSEVPR